MYGYLTQGHERNNDYVRMNPAATGIIRQGMGVYATQRLRLDTNTPWATTERGAHIHAYQPMMPCRLPHPDNHNTIIFADASGTTSLTPAAGAATLELEVGTTNRLHQRHLTGATIFGASSHGEHNVHTWLVGSKYVTCHATLRNEHVIRRATTPTKAQGDHEA